MDMPSLTTEAGRLDAATAKERRKREALAEKEAVPSTKWLRRERTEPEHQKTKTNTP
jgi:hypothetical protein